jgi:hypothetical protein
MKRRRLKGVCANPAFAAESPTALENGERLRSSATASGGLMVFLTAVRYGVDAAVAYYDGDTKKYLG